MKKQYVYFSLIICIGLSLSSLYAQVNDSDLNPSTVPPAPRPTPPKISMVLSETLNELPQDHEISRERREQAYVKLLEGQRYLWSMRRVRSMVSIQSGARLAKEALQKAVELNPNLAEAYTALAELALTAPPQDIDEAILLSEIAVKLDKDNFGAYRFLGRQYTIKSNLGRENLDGSFAAKAIAAWLEITRLDPRYAEGWAFLSAFYEEKGQKEKRIDALKNWMSASAPLETGFYSRVLVKEGELTTEAAALKLGQALLDAGRNNEALVVITRAVSDSPENFESIELLSRALEDAEPARLNPVTEALRQAVYANPTNLSLYELLAKTLARSGRIDDAATFINNSITVFVNNDKPSAANLLITLGDIYENANRIDEALGSYRKSLLIRGISDQELATDDERDFAFLVIGKMIEIYKKANRFEDAKNLIESSRILFGKDDLTLDREYINLLRDHGRRQEALKAIRSARIHSPTDYSLLRTEASLLTEMGRVDQGVDLIRNLIENKPESVPPSVMYDDFINYLYISTLYNQSDKTDEAITAAAKAIESAKGKENKQIAKMTLASAEQSAGNFGKAEQILREVLDETPENPIALNNLGYLFLESGKNFQEALGFIKRAIRIDPRNPSYLDSLGWAYYKLKNFDEAEKYLIQAIRFDSNSATILDHLGDVYFKNGKTTEAVEAWNRALVTAYNPALIERLKVKLTR